MSIRIVGEHRSPQIRAYDRSMGNISVPIRFDKSGNLLTSFLFFIDSIKRIDGSRVVQSSEH